MEDDYYGMRMNLDIIKHYSVKPAILPAFATDENEGVSGLAIKMAGSIF